jgi:hypothetical protein
MLDSFQYQYQQQLLVYMFLPRNHRGCLRQSSALALPGKPIAQPSRNTLPKKLLRMCLPDQTMWRKKMSRPLLQLSLIPLIPPDPQR